MSGHPLMIYVPGLLPKPEAGPHKEALFRCLLTGLCRVDPPVANAIERTTASFDVISWTYDFYRTSRDIRLDSAAIDAVIQQTHPRKQDIAEASSVLRRITRWIYHLGDLLPFLIPHFAPERMEVHLRDLRRYVHNKDGISDHVRRMLKVALLAASGGRHPVLLIGHSMGSVISYDSLWELSHSHGDPAEIDMLLTLGSPLGQRYLQRRIKGHDLSGRDRYPSNIRCWKNLSAVGDLTALDPWLANDYGEMARLGLVEAIEDEEILTWFRLDGELNVHSEYGYLVNDTTARTVAEWWRSHDPDV